MTLNFFIKGQAITCRTPDVMVSDTVKYFDAKFSFLSNQWDETVKWAFFSVNDEKPFSFLLEDDKITKDKNLSLSAGKWSVWLLGETTENGEATGRITTNKCYFDVEQFGESEGEVLPDIPMTEAEQIAAVAQNALNVANSVRADADAGKFDGFSPSVAVEKIEENGSSGIKITVQNKDGAETAKVFDGKDGKSAFQYAVDGGYIGTEEEFYEFLALSDERFARIESDIADLKYVPIAVSSFSHNAGTRENGDKVSSVVLSWVLNKVPESLVIDGVQTEKVQSGSVTVAEEITSNRTFNLKAIDDREKEATKSTTIYFYDGVYYGCAEEPATVNSEFILSLTKKLSSGKNLTVSVTGGENKFFWYAYPASMGESIFNIGGFDYEYEYETVSFTNKFGVTKDYNVYKSGQPIPGSISVTVKEG